MQVNLYNILTDDLVPMRLLVMAETAEKAKQIARDQGHIIDAGISQPKTKEEK